MAGTFLMTGDDEQGYRFNLLAEDGRLMAVSIWYATKRTAVHGVELFRECAGTGLIVDAAPESDAEGLPRNTAPTHGRAWE